MPIVACASLTQAFDKGLHDPMGHVQDTAVAQVKRGVRGANEEGGGGRSSTWYVLSNLSYMNLVMMLVLPTD